MLHDEDDPKVEGEWVPRSLVSLLKSGKDLDPVKDGQEALRIVSERVETLHLKIVKFEWGKDDV